MLKIYHEDCRSGLKRIKHKSVDLVVTSPPYKDEDGYSRALMQEVFRAVWDTQKENTLLFVNFGHLADDKFRPFEVCKDILDIGYKLNDTIVWVKNHYKPIQGRKRVNNLTEFIFLFYKEKMPNIDRLAIGVPYKDKSNVGRFATHDLKCRGNVWEIPYQTIKNSQDKLHNDRFPLDLPKNCIKLSAIPQGSLVLDPFAGSGTTLVAAEQQGMDAVGFEINPLHVQTIKTRIPNIEIK